MDCFAALAMTVEVATHGFSVQSLTSLEHWIVRPSAQLRTRRTMTTEYVSAISRRDADANGRSKADLAHSGCRQLKLLTYKPAYLDAKRSRERREGRFRRDRSGNDGSNFELFGDGDVFRRPRSSPGPMLRCTPVLFTPVPE